MESPDGKRIAVIGSGISGLSAAWLLHTNGAHVTLYEAEPTCGGHTLTDESCGYPVDLGFQVFNLTTYPNMTAFLDALGVDSEPSDMSFALSVDGGRLEWASHSLSTVFAQRSNALSPSFLNMIRDVLRFGSEALRVLEPSLASEYGRMNLGKYLAKHRYSQAFINNYVLPMCAAVWSVPAAQVLEFPVTMLVRFWSNHHLLDVLQRPRWRVVVGRSRAYVGKVVATLPDVRTGTPVTSVRSFGAGGPVHVTAADGTAEYDAVVMATHSDVSLRLLGPEAPANLRDVLSGVPYNDNDVWLHTDASLMPKSRSAWASWNCISASGPDVLTRPVCVSYWVNSLQTLPKNAPDLFVTLNPIHPPAPETVHRRLTLAHPVFGEASLAAQSQLRHVQGLDGIFLAGAWAGYGFHEDGIKSAIDVVQAMGGNVPWVPRPCSPKLSWVDSAAIGIFDRFARATIRTGRLRFILPNGEELQYGAPAPPLGGVSESWRKRPPLDATVRIYDASFFRKVISRHDTGLGESYMDGDYDVIPNLNGAGGDLGSLLAVATANAHNIEAQRGLLGMFNRFGDRALHLAHLTRSNTAANARRNIEEHYDAGNAMYRLFLDETMTYSSGIWSDPSGGGAHATSLYQSQLNKLDALIAKADLCPEHHVLEIGCGWGSFAIRAATTRGCRVTGLTLSKEQLAEARARVAAAGLEDKVTLLLCDYRDCPGLGTYDRVVSCEMIEAVGHEHLGAYFATIGAALKPGGRAVLQVIAEPDERYEAYCASSDFIREHVFPGGHLPCVGACVENARGTGLSVHGCEDIGPDYAVTLRAWREAWERHRDEVLELGYSARFWRKYRFYFAYCEAGFDARYIHTFQLTWVKDRPMTLTEEDLCRALERSKGGNIAQAIAANASTSTPTTAIAQSTIHPPNGDALTQLLVCLYFFLAGAAVSTTPALCLLPVATVTSLAVCAACSAFSRWVSPSYASLAPDQAALWSLQLTHILYSLLAACCAAAFLVSNPPDAVLLVASQPSEPFARALVAASAGFFAFVVWALVQGRLYRRSYFALLHYVILLSVFAISAHKAIHTPLMALMLISEANTAVAMARRHLQLARGGRFSSSFWTRVLAVADVASFATFRVLLHVVLGAIVVKDPQPFAAAAVAYMNILNVKDSIGHLQSYFAGMPAQKTHVA